MEASAEAARELASVGVAGSGGLDQIRLERTKIEEAESRLAAARARRDDAYGEFEELAPGRVPSEVESIIADHEAEVAEATVRAEAEAAARKAEADAKTQAEAEAAARKAEAEAAASTAPSPAEAEPPAPVPAPVRALAERLSAEGRQALARIEAQLAALDRVELAKRSLEWHEANGVRRQWGRAGPPAERLSRFGLPGHGLGATAEAGHPLPLDGVVSAAPARPAAPAEHVALPAEPGVERVRGVVEGADAAGLPDRLLQLGQPSGTAGRETTG